MLFHIFLDIALLLNMIKQLLLAIRVRCEFLGAAVEGCPAVLDEVVISWFDPFGLGFFFFWVVEAIVVARITFRISLLAGVVG